ncbi:hypothetical protein BDP55DRAFT_88219 [Colletotrichum godetiae]|uniref:Uncharacterized protein n=1 Tax=Colletotrichum godetiae TaxID=1209918 RepID=A0AAJ0EZS9_9PEZI|nr:uncharacterized protein BDP55DRAFT_88219 [Colletotrichum godetiae]KAK1687823.1 hypothetical protein BDP55DRAFT_88219 [Colletotrichum godetiae]
MSLSLAHLFFGRSLFLTFFFFGLSGLFGFGFRGGVFLACFRFFIFFSFSRQFWKAFSAVAAPTAQDAYILLPHFSISMSINLEIYPFTSVTRTHLSTSCSNFAFSVRATSRLGTCDNSSSKLK